MQWFLRPVFGHTARHQSLRGFCLNWKPRVKCLAAEKYAEQYGITVVLKGAGTVVADNNYTAANHTGNAGMSVGGSGDVLAGIIGSAVAQGCGIFDGACAGVYMHGLAGDIAAQKLSMEAMLPRDIISNLPEKPAYIKIFVFDNMSGINPLCEYTNISI